MKRRYVILIFIGVILAWLLCGYLLYEDTDGRGTFGDMFGTINALFSGLAFAGVIIALFLQKKELQLQREELEQTRKELEGQKEQLENQNTTFQEQSFQTAFFQMLKFHNDKIDGMRLASYEGRGCFAEYYKQFKKAFIQKRYDKEPENEQLECMRKTFETFWCTYQAQLGQYYKSLYVIMKFIKDSSYKKHSFDILKSQFSNDELCLLFYYCRSQIGYPKLGKYVHDYSLFEDLDRKQLIKTKIHERAFSPQAYGLDTHPWSLL